MKTQFLFLSLFLLVSHSLGASAPNPVHDTEGKVLRADTGYYILPVPIYRSQLPSGRDGGGLTLAATRNKTCPLDVVQELNGFYKGLPVTFAPVNFKKGVIRESTDMNIMFSTSTKTCSHYSNVWKLDKFDRSRKQYFVTSGGVEGNPSPQTINNWFKIVRYTVNEYKLVFCPTVCKYCKAMCKDVGVFVENGRRLLALSDVPLRVRFQKA